jgi:anti-sigma regulatory factor (Ser/Thr protein kinase)
MRANTRQLIPPLPSAYLSNLRRWARSLLERHPTAANPDDVVLAMTEMVSNALRHGAGPVDVEFSLNRPLVLRVSDCSDELPRQLRGDHSWSGGRGMIVVDAVASRWGVQYRAEVGKTVWCEFPDAAGQPTR